eukprot:COSAG02_NODE_4055_length_5840_cov_3.261656_3_plen_560_part_00
METELGRADGRGAGVAWRDSTVPAVVQFPGVRSLPHDQPPRRAGFGLRHRETICWLARAVCPAAALQLPCTKRHSPSPSVSLCIRAAVYSSDTHGVQQLPQVVRFRTAYFDPESGIVCRDPKRIANWYLRSWAILDIPSATPFELANTIFAIDPSVRLLQLMKLVQVMRIVRVARALRELQAAFHHFLNSTIGLLHVNISYSAVKIGKLFLGLVIIAHYNACLWFLIGSGGKQPEELSPEGAGRRNAVGALEPGGANFQSDEVGWVVFYGKFDLDPSEQYLVSFYFVFTCMTTVGFGDITPHLVSEIIFSAYCMFVGCTTFGYIVGIMSSEASANAMDEEYLHKIDYMDGLMQVHNVKTSVRRRVQRHYTYQKEAGMGFASNSIFPELPHGLRRDLVLCLHNKEQVEPAIGHNMDYEFVAELLLIMRVALAEQDEMVCRIGELAQEVYILKAGEIQIFHPPSALAGRISPITVRQSALVCEGGPPLLVASAWHPHATPVATYTPCLQPPKQSLLRFSFLCECLIATDSQACLCGECRPVLRRGVNSWSRPVRVYGALHG